MLVLLIRRGHNSTHQRLSPKTICMYTHSEMTIYWFGIFTILLAHNRSYLLSTILLAHNKSYLLSTILLAYNKSYLLSTVFIAHNRSYLLSTIWHFINRYSVNIRLNVSLCSGYWMNMKMTKVRTQSLLILYQQPTRYHIQMKIVVLWLRRFV